MTEICLNFNLNVMEVVGNNLSCPSSLNNIFVFRNCIFLDIDVIVVTLCLVYRALSNVPGIGLLAPVSLGLVKNRHPVLTRFYPRMWPQSLIRHEATFGAASKALCRGI